jgi:two-component system chemotaxis sensor kinase CheA
MSDAGQGQPATLRFDLDDDDQALFLTELDELLQRVEESLVDLERAPDDRALLNDIFRAAHTIKGSSATIGHHRMAALTHALETRLDDLRKGIASVTPQLIEALLSALDVLKLLRDEVETRVPAEVDVEAALIAVERRASNRGDGAMAAVSSSRPAAAPAERPQTNATHRVTVGLEQGPWQAVRALQVLLALGEHGTLVSSTPTQAEIENEEHQIGQTLLAEIRSEATEAALRQSLSLVPELTAIDIEARAEVSADAVSAEPAPPIDVPSSGLEAPTAVSAAAASVVATRRAASATTIRIDVARLDTLLNLVGELVIDRTRLVQLGNALVNRFGDDRMLSDLQQTALHIGRVTDELQEQVMKSRMVAVETVFNRLPRVVRDVASRQGKQIDFIMEGKDTELDRSVVEEIGDPLLHLIRNAVDHGVETPEQRLAAGKSPMGTVRLTARHAGSHILITLRDDGSGINVEAVKRKAVERGVVTLEQADRLSEREAVHLIFAPGLSTAHSISDVSGRGVGMDVVRANVEKLNGSVDVETRPGEGTTFIIRLPLTLAIVQALLVRVAGGTYALPMHAVTETLRVESRQIQRLNQREVIHLRNTVLPLVAMRRVFGLEHEAPALDARSSRLVVAVQATHSRQVGLIVDELVGEQEIVIKPLASVVGEVAGISGAAILGDGSVALIVDVPALIGRSLRDDTTRALFPTSVTELVHRYAA